MDSGQRHLDFSQRLERHHARLFSYVFSMVRNLDDAQDVLQETCLTLWEKYDDYDPQTPFCAWAFTVARFKVLSHVDRKRRRSRQFNPQVLAELAAIQASILPEESDARRDALRRCIEKLSQQQRSLLWKCYETTRSVKQTAEQLGRTPHSVHNSLRWIRQKLMECIDHTLAREARA